MSIFGLTHTNPQLAMHLIDTAKWRIVVYADSPTVLGRFERHMAQKDTQRRTVLFLFGALHIAKVVPMAAEFDSVIVLDDVENLNMLRNHITGFSIEDVDAVGVGAYPRYLTPAQLATVMDMPGSLPSQLPIISVVTHALSRKRPSVLESMGKVPSPSLMKATHIEGVFRELEGFLTDEDPNMGVLLTAYAKVIFKIGPTDVTKSYGKAFKLDEAREVWKRALTMSDSVTNKFAKCFQLLCSNTDPDLKIRDVAKRFNAVEHADDLLYLSRVFPPSPSWANSMRREAE